MLIPYKLYLHPSLPLSLTLIYMYTLSLPLYLFLLLPRHVLLAGFVREVLLMINNREESVSSQAETFQPSQKFTPANVRRIEKKESKR